MHIDINIKYITNEEGLKFFTQRWIPKNPKALIVLVHGFGDHSGRYMHVINHFARNGYAVATFDQRGHGLSGGKRGHIENFTDLIEDLRSFIKETRTEVPQGTPLFVIAMSVGALVAINHAVFHPSEVEGLVVISPAIKMRFEVPKWMKFFGNKLSHFMAKFPVKTDFSPEDLSQDKEVVKAYKKDSLVFRKFTLRTCQQILDAMLVVMPLAFRIRHPVLMIHAEGDNICSAEATKEFYRKMETNPKKLLLLDAPVHEPFNDFIRDDVFNEIDNWLEANTEVFKSNVNTKRKFGSLA